MRKRSPFPDEVARALADEANLARLAEVHDPADFGLRDIWETIIVTGRRVSEVLQLRLDCTGRYGGLAMLWHDQTKVGRYDQAIRIPEPLSERLAARRETTVSRFIARHGRAPTAAERAAMALFPGRYRNPDGTAAVTYQWFHSGFKAWVDELDIGRWVPHQARHTLATSLLRHGATLTHIRRYLGHVSDRMAEHYIQLSHSDLEDVLQHVWVAGPGTASPGTLLSGPAAPMTREQAQALAIDLSRRSTPAEGGFCTFQPVVDGGACPWNLDCHNCAKLRAVRRRPALLAAQTRAVVLHRRTRPRRRHRQLAAPGLRADRGRHRRAGSRPGRRSACSTTRSPWTCAARRTTSSGSGTSGSAPPSSPAPPQTRTPSPMTSRTRTATS